MLRRFTLPVMVLLSTAVGTSETFAQEVVQPNKKICSPSVVVPADLYTSAGIPTADQLFIHKNFAPAFRVEYQYFFCFDGDGQSINASFFDSGAAQLLQRALGQAYRGQYVTALKLSDRSFTVDQRFGEAKLVSGQLNWILGRVQAARDDWNDALSVQGVLLPPDHPQVPARYVGSATVLLRSLRDK